MSEELPPPALGTMAWMDLTAPNADDLAEFYANVVGWQKQAVSMGEYDDFVMVSPTDGVSCSGICHARGVNEKLPPVWLVYVLVADLSASIEACNAGGGEVLVGPRHTQGGDYAIIRDPAGAHLALFQQQAKET
ncbi:MAG: VOC family protein [Xanthomonadales bacterium]|nr:VOC family protein [Xanthomonadales bacterium]